ncbi:hypothetical protein MAFF212519_07660 [Clavibacter michiganensis]
MERSVVLLRGINVGRAKQVPMAQLAATLEGLGYLRVRTTCGAGTPWWTTSARAAGVPRWPSRTRCGSPRA